MRSYLYSAVILCSITFTGAVVALAAQPDAGSILRDIGDRPKPFPERQLERPTSSEQALPDLHQGIKVTVKGFRVTGATQFSEAELQNVMAAYVGKDMTFNELNLAIQQLSSFYMSKGLMVQALLPPQDVIEGIITIQLLEGRLSSVVVERLRGVRFSEDRVKKFIVGRQPVGQPIRVDAIEEALLLLNDVPGVVATANLQAGNETGATDLLVKLDRSPLITGALTGDNNGSISTGEYRLTADLNVNNMTGIGDQVSVKGLFTDGSSYGRIAYGLPAGSGGTRLNINYSTLHYELGGDFKALVAAGDAVTAGAALSIPFIHRRSQNFYGTVGYDYRNYNNSSHGLTTSAKVIQAGTIGLSGDFYDNLYGGGYNSLSVNGNVANLDLSGNGANKAADQAGPGTDGVYSKLSYSLSRVQKIQGDKTSVQVSINGQFAFKNLDSSEKISLGGPGAVRALPPNEGSGDEGFVMNAELHHNLTDTLQFFGFYDYGWLKQHHSLYNGWNSTFGAPNTYSADGVGLGIAWGKQGLFSVKAIVAERLSANPGANAQGNDSDGTLREPRFWLLASVFY